MLIIQGQDKQSPTYTIHFNQLLETTERQGYIQFSMTFKDIVEEIYFDLSNTSYDMYKEKYKWEILIKKRINPFVK